MTSIARSATFATFLVLACVALAPLAGCGPGAAYTGAERAAVSGSITLDGEPLPYGTIMFLGEGENRQSSGLIQDGSYSIDENNGPNLGDYRVLIEGSEAPPVGEEEAEDAEEEEGADPDSAAAAENIVPGKYNADSELKVTITSGSNTHDFPLTSE